MSPLNVLAVDAPLVVVDIDGTLSDCMPRLKFAGLEDACCELIDQTPERMRKLRIAMDPGLVKRDPPITRAIEWLDIRLRNSPENVRYLTGRWETLRQATDEWLLYWTGWHFPVGDMRPEYQTSMPVLEFKRQYISRYPKGTLLIDDDPAVVAMATEEYGLRGILAPDCFNL